MKLSIVIVNYNVKYFVEQCLIAVEKAVKNISAEVVVVDNASSDNSVEYLQKKFNWVKFIASKENLGFSKGNNIGIAEAKGQYILLLNPDTVVAEDTFEKAIAFMDSHPEAGALGVHMIDGKGNFLPESKRGLPTPSVAFYKTFGLAAFFPKSKTFGRYHLGFLPEHQTHAVEVLSGAFMFIRKEVLDKIGLLDESFFMYGEDIDLSYRIIKAGYKNFYFPDTTIIHYKGESTKKGSLNYVKVFYNAMIIFADKHFSGNQLGIYNLFINLAIFFRGLLTVIANLFSSSFLFIIDAFLSFVGVFFIKTYWANMIKYTDHYYPNIFLFAVVPVYILIWIVSTFLAGGYDKPYKVSNIIRGIFFGTLAIAAIYGFLPNEWRFSRAMIILGAFWTALEMILTRISYHWIKYQSLSIESDAEKRTIIVGDSAECNRAEQLLKLSGTDNEIVTTTQNIAEIEKLTHIYNLNEIVFCSQGINFKNIIEIIRSLGNQIDYKIFNAGSDTFIGSNSKNTAGDIYLINHSLKLAKADSQRRKRFLDFLICLILMLLLPIDIFVIPHFAVFARNWLAVLTNKKTWVGYARNLNTGLPALKPGILDTTIGFEPSDIDDKAVSKLNFLYAKNYAVASDLKLVFQNFRKLGK